MYKRQAYTCALFTKYSPLPGGVSFVIDDQFSEDASASIMKTIEKGKFSFTSSGSDAIRKAVRDSLSNFIWSRTRTRPMIIPVVMEV